MGIVWLGSSKRGTGDADARYADGCVWSGSRFRKAASAYGDAIARYDNEAVWLGNSIGGWGDADARFEDGCIWLGSRGRSASSASGDAVARYKDGCIWLGSRGRSASSASGDAVARYAGPDDGAVAAAVALLYDDLTESDHSVEETTADHDDHSSDGASSNEQSPNEEDDRDSDQEEYGPDYDDHDYDDHDYSSEPSSPAHYTPPAVLEDPAVVAERRLAAANTMQELRAIKLELSEHLSSQALDTLYRTKAEELISRTIDDMIRQMNGKTVDQLSQEYKMDSRLSLDEQDSDSYKLYLLAWQIDQVWNHWHSYELYAWQGWNEEHPTYTILARRRLKEITDKETEARAATELTALEPIEHATYSQLTNFFFNHRSANTSLAVVPRVNDRYALAQLYQNYRRFPIGQAAKKRCLEILDEEYNKQGFWEKMLTFWLRQHKRYLLLGEREE